MSISMPDAQPGQAAPVDGFTDPIGNVGTATWPTVDKSTKSFLCGTVALFVKHIADRTIAIAALLILAPFLAMIAIAVKLSSPGPALFVHERVGLNGRPFRILKFRTMKVGAADQLPELLRRHDRDGEPLFKVPDDPRVTRFGQWLRRWSLDELPQLWNVLMGQMSLVGPRPQVGAEVALYSDQDMERLRVRPGITGLWQVSGRSELPWKQAIQLDLHYIEKWSMLLDLWILARTLQAVISGRGAL